MKTIRGYFEAYGDIEVEDNATDEEIREKMATHLEFKYFTWLCPEDVVIEGEVEPYLEEVEDIPEYAQQRGQYAVNV